MFSSNRNLKKISISLIASALFYVSILNHSKFFKSSSSSSNSMALLAKSTASAAAASTGAASSSGQHSSSSSSTSSAYKSSSRQHKKLFEQISPTFTMIFLIIFYCFCSLCLVVNVNAQENIYYYTDGDAIQMQNNGANEDNHLETLLDKNFFSVFSSEMSILNTVENQSTNGHKLTNDNNDDHRTIYSSTSSGAVLTDNQIPIAKFRPAVLDFKSQSIGIPKMETVEIHNTGTDVLRLDSLSGNTVHFYCSFFVQKVIQPGGNTTFDVYFLARDVGTVDSSLYVNTNKGIIKYTVTGTGTPNPYRLKPIASARIPINSSFHTNIELHNPHDRPMQILEIYTSDDDSHLELPFASSFAYNSPLVEHNTIIDDKDLSSESPLNKKLNRNESSASQANWVLHPYETKYVAKLRYMGRQANNHTSFVCVKIATNLNISVNESSTSGDRLDIRATNGTKIISIILPIEVEVSDKPGLFTPIESINFDVVSIRPTSEANAKYYETSSFSSLNGHFAGAKRNRAFELYVYSTARSVVTIEEIYSLRQNAAIKIFFYKGLQIPPSLNQLTKIADIVFDPTQSKKQSQNYGKILVKTNDSDVSLKIDFSADLHVGSFEFQREQTMFLADLTASSKLETSQAAATGPELVTQHVDLINNYHFPIVIHNISLNKNAQKYFQIKNFKKPTILSGQLDRTLKTPSKVFEIEFNRTQYTSAVAQADSGIKSDLFVSVRPPVGYCTIQTNFTTINLPIYVFDGLLSFTKHENSLTNKSESEAPQNEEEDFLDNFHVDILNINSRRQFTFKIANPNPVDIKFTKFELLRPAADPVESHLSNTIEFKYLRYEKLPNLNRKEKWDYTENVDEPEVETPELNGTFVNEQIRDHVQVPAHHKLVLQLDITNQLSKAARDFVFSSNLFKYELVIGTKYQLKKFKLEFYVVNGTLELRDRSLKAVDQVDFKTFPTQLPASQFNLRSTFAQTLKISSVTFAEYGNAFTFKWNIPFMVTVPAAIAENENSTANATTTSYQTKNSVFGQIQAANETTKIGYVYFDPSVLCAPNCYLGFSKASDSITSTDGAAELTGSKPEADADTYSSDYERRRAQQHQNIHALWAKSFELSPNVPLNKNVSIYDLDSQLFRTYRDRWLELNQNQRLFRSKLRLQIELDDGKSPVAADLLTGTLEERQQKMLEEEAAKKFLVYSFPIAFKFKWPRLIRHKPTVTFPLTQVNVATRLQNVTLYNPSNSSVLVQVVLLRQYPNRFEFLGMMEKHPDFFFENRYTSLIKDLITEHTPVVNRCCRCQPPRQPPASKTFKLKSASSIKQTSLATQRAIRTVQLLDMSPNKESLVMLLEPFATSVVEVQFQPHRLGEHLDVLIVRNNLTILDAILLKGSGGSGELRINNQPPMRTSLFYDGYFVKSNGEYEPPPPSSKSSPEQAAATADTIAKMYKTVDISSVSIQMNDKDYDKCRNRQLEPIESMQVNTNSFTFFGAETTKEPVSSDQADATQPPAQFVQGIVLRRSFELKNVGTSDLTVFQILFDGEPCSAYGFAINNCQPFTLEPGQVRPVEVKYHPDFTMSYVSKRLTINTNIGDLEYLIDVRIPYHMLTLCHDALPRPSLEGHIFYLGLFIIAILVGAMLLSSFAESRVLLKYEREIRKKIRTLNDDSSLKKQEFINELKLQRSFNIRNFLSRSFDLNFLSSSSAKPKQAEFHANGHKSLAKASSSPRVDPQTTTTSSKKGSLQGASALTNSRKKLDVNNSTDSVVGEQLPAIPKTFGSPKVRRSQLSKQTSAPQMPPPSVITTPEEYQANASTDDEPQLPDNATTSSKTVTFAKNITTSSTPSSATSSPRAIKNKLKQASLVSTSNSSKPTAAASSKAEKAQRDRDSNSSTPSPPPPGHQKSSGSLGSIYPPAIQAQPATTNSPVQKRPATRPKTAAATQKSSQPAPSQIPVSQPINSNRPAAAQPPAPAAAQPQAKAPSLIKPGQNNLQFRELFLNKSESPDPAESKSRSSTDSEPGQPKSKDAADSREFVPQTRQTTSPTTSASQQPPRVQNNNDLANLMALLAMNNIDLTQFLNNNNINANLNNNYFPNASHQLRPTNNAAAAAATAHRYPQVSPTVFGHGSAAPPLLDYQDIMSTEQQKQLDQLNSQFLNIQRQKKQMERDSLLNNQAVYAKLNSADLTAPALPNELLRGLAHQPIDFSSLSSLENSGAWLNLLVQASQQESMKASSSAHSVPDGFSSLQSQLLCLPGIHDPSNYYSMFNVFQELLANSYQPAAEPRSGMSVQSEAALDSARAKNTGSCELDHARLVSLMNDYEIIESNSDDELGGLAGEAGEVGSNSESYCESPTSDIWLLPGKSDDPGQGSNSILEDADVDFDNLVKETAQFDHLHQKPLSLEVDQNGKPRVESSKPSQKAEKRSASRSYSMPFQQASTNSDQQRLQESLNKLKAANVNFDSVTQPKAPGPIQRPVNAASNQASLNSFFGEESKLFAKGLLWPVDKILLNNRTDPIGHLNIKATNTSDDDLVLLSKDPSAADDSGPFNPALKFNEFRLFGNVPTEPSKSAIGATDLLGDILGRSSMWPANEPRSNQDTSTGNVMTTSLEKSSMNAPWNSILLDDYQCSPLAAADDGTGIKFDFAGTKSEEKLKSIWSDVSSKPEDKETK